MKEVILVTALYFLIGACLIPFTGKPQSQKWIKYFFYLIVVTTTLLMYYFGLGIYFNSIIVLIGGYEIFVNFKKSIKSIIAIIGLLVLSSTFIIYTYLSNPLSLIYLYCLVFTFDGFSQIGGQILGKHQLSSISPKKTVEGLIIGFLTLIVTSFLFPVAANAMINLTFAVTCGIMAYFGDIIASWFKRSVGIKDYSSLIPGHGGVLDRYDSLIGASFPALLFQLLVLH